MFDLPYKIKQIIIWFCSLKRLTDLTFEACDPFIFTVIRKTIN